MLVMSISFTELWHGYATYSRNHGLHGSFSSQHNSAPEDYSNNDQNTAAQNTEPFNRELEVSAELVDNTFTEKEVDTVKKMTGGLRASSLKRTGAKVGHANQIQASLLRTETGFSDSEYEDR